MFIIFSVLHILPIYSLLSFDFAPQSGQPGTYMLRQLCATVGEVQFVLSHIYPSVRYEVYSQEPQLTVEPLSGLNLCCMSKIQPLLYDTKIHENK